MAENPQLNKSIATIFANYLKKEFRCGYKAIGSRREFVPDGYPDVDEILDSKRREHLFLQCKRPIEIDNTFVGKRARKNKGMAIFSLLLEKTIENFENKYRIQNKDISNIILLLHSDPCLVHFIPSDCLVINKDKFVKSGFRGIYIISQKYNWYKGKENGVQKEFIFEIKNAFYEPNRKILEFEYIEDYKFFVDLLSGGNKVLFNKKFKDYFDFRDSKIKRKEFNNIRNKAFKELKSKYGLKCQLKVHPDCSKVKKFDIDHFIPLSTNELNKKIRHMIRKPGHKVPAQSFGSNNIMNLLIACSRCNSYKKHRIIKNI